MEKKLGFDFQTMQLVIQKIGKIDQFKGEWKTGYYQALMEGQKNRYQAEERIDKWMLFFLDCVLEMIDRLKKKLAIYKETGSYLSERQRLVLAFIGKHQPVKIGDISAHFLAISVPTIRKEVQYLVQQYEIEQIGRNKGTFYVVRD